MWQSGNTHPNSKLISPSSKEHKLSFFAPCMTLLSFWIGNEIRRFHSSSQQTSIGLPLGIIDEELSGMLEVTKYCREQMNPQKRRGLGF